LKLNHQKFLRAHKFFELRCKKKKIIEMIEKCIVSFSKCGTNIVYYMFYN